MRKLKSDDASSLSYVAACALLLLVGLLTTVAESAAGETRFLAEVDVSPRLITFRPQIPYTQVRVTVTGAEGFQEVQTFDNTGESPSISLPDLDGLYKFELRFAPVLDDQARAALAAARLNGTEPAETEATSAEATVQSGAFTISNGSVVADEPEPTPTPIRHATNGVGNQMLSTLGRARVPRRPS